MDIMVPSTYTMNFSLSALQSASTTTSTTNFDETSLDLN
jgi:hypothetical protein